MRLVSYTKNLKHQLRPRSVTFLVKNEQILLGKKKEGFGKGYWIGIGGKVEPGETLEVGAKRELQEEIAIHAKKLEHIGYLNFYFPHKADESWNQQVHYFICKDWEDKPTESSEIKPKWFDQNKIPYDLMWDDYRYWLPLVLEGKKIKGEVMFDENLKVSEYKFH
jgi:mutator protein MutT